MCNIWEEITTIMNTGKLISWYCYWHYKVNVIKYISHMVFINLKQSQLIKRDSFVILFDEQVNHLSPHDALKHHFKSLKTHLIFLQPRVSEWKLPLNWHTNTSQFSLIFKPHQIIPIHYNAACNGWRWQCIKTVFILKKRISIKQGY